MLKNRVFPVITTVLAVCLVSVTLAQAGLKEDSAALDRAYVPALALTNQPDKAGALVAESIERLCKAWRVFVEGASPKDMANPAFARAVDESTLKISSSLDLAAAGKRQEAHEALEYIRTALAGVRKEMGIDCLPDRFTAFHDVMEEFAAVASKPEPDAATLDRLLDELSKLWGAVEGSPIDSALFKLPPERTAKYVGQVKRVREILVELAGLINSKDRKALAGTAKALKGTFAQTYFVFGDFSGL